MAADTAPFTAPFTDPDRLAESRAPVLPAPPRRLAAPAPVRAPRAARSGGPPRRPPWVLMYHSVSGCTDDPYRITVSPYRLDRQLRWLRARGLSGVGVGALLRARAAGRGAGLVGLTFDDGYADFVESALPLLRRHGCSATLFVLPGRLGGDNVWDERGPRKPLLTGDGVRAAAAGGMEIGSHGLLHTDLTTADKATLEAETRESRELIEEITGSVPEGFCYPYGSVDGRAVEAVRAAGYDYACAIDPGALTCVHALPRVHIGAEDTSLRLHVKRALHPLRRRPVPDEPPGTDTDTNTDTGTDTRTDVGSAAPTDTTTAPARGESGA